MPMVMPDVDTEEEDTPEQPDLQDLMAKGALGKAYADDTDVVSGGDTPAPAGTAAQPAEASSPAVGAMGNAFSEPDTMAPGAPDMDEPSDAANSMGQFATATGTTAPAQAPGTHLSQVGPPPTPPTMDPDFAKTQADLRAKSAVTAKIDPATGKTLDQYKPSVGARIGRAFLDAGRGFLSHGLAGAISAPLEGAFGNRNAPGYYGKGAVNSQYTQDEAARQRDVVADTAKIGSFEDQQKQSQTQFKDQNDVYKDSLGNAYKQDLNDIKQQTENEKERHNQETEELKGKLQSATTPQAKLQAEIDARTAIAKQLNMTGRDAQLYRANGKMPDDDTIQRNLQIKEEELGIQRTKAAREAGTDGGQWYTTPRELADYKTGTSSLDREASALESRKALYTEGGTADKESQAALGRINARLDAIEKQKDSVKQGIISNRPSKPAAAQPSANTTPADTSDIPAAEFNPRTGDPLAGITAANNDGTQATPVTGKDAQGRPTISISPKAPVPTSGNEPQLTPVPDKSVKTKGGRTLNVGDDIPGHGKIKGFGKDAAGKINAMF